VIVEARVEGLLPVFDSRVRSERDGWNGRDHPILQRADLLHKRVSIFSRHRDVADQDIGTPRLDGCERVGGACFGSYLSAFASKNHLQQIALVGSIINDENSNPFEVRLARSFGTRETIRLASRVRAGQKNRKRRAAIFSATGNAGHAAVELDDVPDNREAEAEAAVRSSEAAVCLSEAIEDMREKPLGNSNSAVGHHK